MGSPAPRVLISYRRKEAGGYARLVFERLAQRFPERVFLDIETLEPGTDFRAAIVRAVEGAGVVVAVVGEAFAGRDEQGRQRLADPDDFVRLELASALCAGVRVIPVLLPHARMPEASALPAELAPLVSLQALSLTEAHLLEDIGQLVDVVAKHFGEERPRVTLSGMASNQGWTVVLHLLDTDVREIFVRVGKRGAFRSTGTLPTRSPRTGLPLPRTDFDLPDDLRSRDVAVKYVDARGEEQGPFPLRFDAEAELVRSTRDDVLERSTWVEARRTSAGDCWAYFTVLSYKNAFSEIRYSIDSMELDRSLRFRRSAKKILPGIDEGDEYPLELPRDARYVCAQLTLIDGSRSDVRKFPVRRED